MKKKQKEKNNKGGSIMNSNIKIKQEKGITLIALVITIIFSYDDKLKSSNNNSFLLQTI